MQRKIKDKDIAEVKNESTVVIAGAIMGGAVMITALKNIFYLIWEIRDMLKKSKVHPKLTDTLRKVDKSGQWTCRAIRGEPNAFAVGTKDLFITHSLLKILTHEECVAVMLHEAGHVNKYHVQKGLVLDSTLEGLFITLAIAFTAVTGLWPIGFLFWVVSKTVGEFTIQNYYSRKFEYQADDYAVKMGYGKEMVSAFGKLMKKFKELKCTTDVCRRTQDLDEMFRTHPRFSKRIEAMFKGMGKKMTKLFKLEPKQAAKEALKIAKEK